MPYGFFEFADEQVPGAETSETGRFQHQSVIASWSEMADSCKLLS
jgi:hypothetical protein